MSKGVCPREYVQESMSKGVYPREYVIGGREKTVSLFLTEALGRFESRSKWSKTKKIRFYVLIRVRRFPDFLFQCVVLLSSSNKFLSDAT